MLLTFNYHYICLIHIYILYLIYNLWNHTENYNRMHLVDMLDIVCLYSSGSITTITVIAHSLPFHCNVLNNSNLFSIELLSNEPIVWSKYFIYTHNSFCPYTDPFTALICAISIQFVNLPMTVSVSNILLETGNTVCAINAIRTNEKIVHLHISVLFFGLMALMIWMF